MYLRSLLLILSVSGLFVAGCQTDQEGGFKEEKKKSWETKAKRHTQIEKLQYFGGSVNLSSMHKRALRQAISKSDHDTVLYSRIMLNVNDSGKGNSALIRRVREIKRCLVFLGVARHRIEVLYLKPSAAVEMSAKERNAINVAVDQYEIILPKCKDWDVMGDKEMPDGETQFGCKLERNFAHMIAEPKDIYDAQPTGSSDGARISLAISKYRKGELNKLIKEKASADGL